MQIKETRERRMDRKKLGRGGGQAGDLGHFQVTSRAQSKGMNRPGRPTRKKGEKKGDRGGEDRTNGQTDSCHRARRSGAQTVVVQPIHKVCFRRPGIG